MPNESPPDARGLRIISIFLGCCLLDLRGIYSAQKCMLEVEDWTEYRLCTAFLGPEKETSEMWGPSAWVSRGPIDTAQIRLSGSTTF